MTGFNVKKLLKNRIPVLKWLPLYRANDALGDLVAGLTVGLTLIPQVLSKPHDFIAVKRILLISMIQRFVIQVDETCV